ncbi:MAG: D-glycero-beta-D-manno-heptose 1,7-bisphosphate 7-phosphatase [Pseudomonadota bacterium]
MLVILDRDGVINQDSDAYIKTLEEWVPVPGSISAIARLSLAGYKIAVATNQSGLARGYFDEITLANMHSLMCDLVEEKGGHIDAVVYCPHGPDEGCNCRKPATGLLEQIGAELLIPIEGAWYVGDSEKDIELANAMKCIPVLVRSGKGAETEIRLRQKNALPALVFDDLTNVADFILDFPRDAPGVV